jgi:hypothetical protein
MVFAIGQSALFGDRVLISNFAVSGLVVVVSLETAGVDMGDLRTDFSSAIVVSPVVNVTALPMFGGGGGGGGGVTTVVGLPVLVVVVPVVVVVVGTTTGIGVGVAQLGSLTPHTPPLAARLKAEPSPPAQPCKAAVEASNAIIET